MSSVQTGWSWIRGIRNIKTAQRYHLDPFREKFLSYKITPICNVLRVKWPSISLWLTSRVVSPNSARCRCEGHLNEWCLPRWMGSRGGWASLSLFGCFILNSRLCWAKQWSKMKICLHFLHSLMSISNVIKVVLCFWPTCVTHLW